MNWPVDDKGIILHIVLPHEGGLVDNPNDPGGITNRGVTKPALAAFRKVAVEQITDDDIINLTLAETIALYQQEYITRVGFDKIANLSVRTAVVDMAVLFGQTGAANAVEETARILEDLHGLPDNAIISDEDARVINQAEARTLINALSVRRILHHADVVQAHPERLEFLKGWDVRACGFVQ